MAAVFLSCAGVPKVVAESARLTSAIIRHMALATTLQNDPTVEPVVWNVCAPTQAAIAISNWFADCTGDIAAAQAFCERHRVFAEMRAAVDLAKGHFKVSSIGLVVERDAEGDGEWLALDVSVDGEVATVLQAYYAYTAEWVNRSSPAKVPLVRLIYNFI